MFLTRSAMFASPLGERVAFYSMSGRETLGQLFSYEVDLLSSDDSLDLSELLGQGATVVLERIDGSMREFTGFVTQFSLVGEHGNYARYRAVLRPWLWFMGQNRNSRIFQAQTVPDIVKDLFRERGFSDVEDKLHGKYLAWEYLVQYRESDLNFISRMLEQEGIYYFFKHDSGKHTLVLADAPTAHEPNPGYDVVPYFPAMARETRQEEHLDSWIVSRQIRQGVVTLRDFNFTYPKPFEADKSAPFKEPGSNLELYDYPAEIHQPSADEAVKATASLAEIRLEEHQADYEVIRAGGPMRGLMAGCTFKLSQFPREDQNKDYLVVSSSYEIHVAEFESNIVADKEPVFRLQLSAIDAKRPYRSPRVTRKPIVEGPQTAIVVGDPEQEIWTDEFGRVKVKFHWDRDPKRDQNTTCWVRVSQAWAGKGWGSIHIPRRDQEVIVDFLEGDPDRPIITGRVYNKDNPAPYTLPDNRTQSGIKSHSSPGGQADNFNEIRFEDKKGAEELHVQAEKDMTTLIKHDRTTNILRNDTLNITGDQFIKIHGNLSMTVEGVTDKDNPDKAKPVKSSMGITGAHTMDASDTIAIQAPNKITFTCGDSVITMVPGKITLTTAGSTIVIDPNIFAQASGKANMLLDANVFAAANGKASVLLDANACVQSSGGSQMLLDGDASLTTGGTVSLHGAKITGKGDSEAGFDGGGSTLALTAASADMSGAQVNVNGKGVVSIGGPMVKIG
jgi:type VI secretion system secreted protein VgrG